MATETYNFIIDFTSLVGPLPYTVDLEDEIRASGDAGLVAKFRYTELTPGGAPTDCLVTLSTALTVPEKASLDAVIAAHTAFVTNPVPSAGPGEPNGIAELDGAGLVPTSQLPASALVSDHTALTSIGVNTHAQIDTHIADTANPHSTDIANLGTGTLAELNGRVTDATLIDTTDSRLSDARTPTAHASDHGNGGGDEISVAGLSGLLADDQNPTAHASDHQHGGSDEVATATAGANAIPKATGAGVLADGFISSGSVTQHEGDIDHDALTNFEIGEHRIINDAGTSTTEMWSASKIDSEISTVVSGFDLKAGVDTSTEGEGDITLSGEQTLNGLLTSTSRVLVTDQTDASENGIYDSGVGAWTRATDYDGSPSNEVANGDIIHVINSGSTKFTYKYLLVTSDPITVGTTDLDFEEHRDIDFGTTGGTATEGNDSRVLSQDENDAALGTDGTPSTSNRFVTNSDSRNTDARTPTAHASAHENGGGDEISVAGLSGLLADDQNPTAHASEHQHGGSDEIATATPAINSIPKTGASANLDSWISATSETVAGKIELATQVEVDAGTDTTKAVTPATLAGATATPAAHASTHENGGADEISVAGLSGLLADDQNPTSHASDHQHGGSDEIATATPAINSIPKTGAAANLDSWVSSASATVQGKIELATQAEVNTGIDTTRAVTPATLAGSTGAPNAHAASHENGGSDEISVAGLSGLLADDQNPTAHAADHENGGSDEISVAGLSGLLADDQNPTAHALGGAAHSADTLASLNSKVSDATLIDTGDSRLSDERTANAIATTGADVNVDASAPPSVGQVLEATSATTATWQTPAAGGASITVEDEGSPLTTGVTKFNFVGTGVTVTEPVADEVLVTIPGTTTHALGGSVHTADTLANLNSKVSDATLIDTGDSRLSDDRTPTAHAASHENGGSDEISVAGLSGLLADAQNPTSHALAGSEHSASTLASLNSKVSDATLIDTGDARLSDERTANAIATTGADVNVDASAPPSTGQVLQATSATTATWQTPSGGGGAESLYWTANDAIFPATTPAAASSRNGHALIGYDDSTNEVIILEGVMPSGYAGADLEIQLHWVAASATSGDVRWGASVERNNTDIDSDSFAAQQVTDDTTNGTSGIPEITVIAFTQAQADGITAGDSFRLEIERVAGNGADTMSGDAQLLRVALVEA